MLSRDPSGKGDQGTRVAKITVISGIYRELAVACSNEVFSGVKRVCLVFGKQREKKLIWLN